MSVEKRGAPSRQDLIWIVFKVWTKTGVSTLPTPVSPLTTPLRPSMDAASPWSYIFFLFLHRRKTHTHRKPNFLKWCYMQHHCWTATKATTSSSDVPFSGLSNSPSGTQDNKPASETAPYQIHCPLHIPATFTFSWTFQITCCEFGFPLNKYLHNILWVFFLIH